MFTDEKTSSMPATSGYEGFIATGEQGGCGVIDPETYERQCALLEHNEQAAKRRAYENEYWRQRTLERQFQLQPSVQNDPDLKPGALDDYPLETMDAKHLVGNLLNVFMDVYNKLRPSRRFLEWVSSMTPSAQVNMIQKAMEDRGYDVTVRAGWVRTFNRGIRYMNAGERSSYQIKIKNGLLYQNGSEFDTSKMKTQLSGPGAAVFVQSVDGTFYSSSHLGGRLKPSSFASNPPCRSAGEWKVENGKINWISGKSGFYQPTIEQLAYAVSDLKSQNALQSDFGIALSPATEVEGLSTEN